MQLLLTEFKKGRAKFENMFPRGIFDPASVEIKANSSDIEEIFKEGMCERYCSGYRGVLHGFIRCGIFVCRRCYNKFDLSWGRFGDADTYSACG